MIKLFRKIRQSLLVQGKLVSYFKYALGEIVLVMIGILLALQVNNWNENRKLQNLESDFLEKIHQEFKNNKAQLEFILAIHKQSLKSSEYILDNYKNPQTPKDSLRKHLKIYKYSYTYNPSKSSIDALVNSGNLSVIKNRDLSNKLIQWDEMVNDFSEEEIYSRNFLDNFIVPFDLEHFKIFSENPDEQYDAFFTLTNEDKNVFLNIIATKKRLLGQIVNNPQSEAAKLLETLDFIIAESAPKR